MTVQLKATHVKKLIKALNLSDQLENSEIALNKSVKVELDDTGKSGEIILKFRHNAKAESDEESGSKAAKKSSSKKSGSKAAKKSDDTGTQDLTLSSSESKKLKSKFKKNLKAADVKSMEESDFGQIVNLNAGPVLIIGVDVDRKKYIAQKENGTTRFVQPNTVRKQLEGSSNSKTAKTSKSKGNKKSSAVEYKIVTKSQTSHEKKISKEEKKAMQAKFVKRSEKLHREGVQADWFFKVFVIGDRKLRAVGLDTKTKKIRFVDINSGKAAKLDLSKLLPF
tara:strand:+ start:2889 stop:3728 length:840 start_codon:yes stop_codon:yes gene_type:complete